MLDQIIKRHRGTVVKRLGDGTMTVFRSARDAIDAALETQTAVSSTELKVRIGVHTGDSLRRDGDYYGVAVNKRHASPGSPPAVKPSFRPSPLTSQAARASASALRELCR